MNRPEKETFFHLAFLEKAFGRKEAVRRFDADEYVRALNDYIDQLENALDKACKELSHACPYGVHRCGTTSHPESWKEWCMKDEENNRQ